MIIGIVAIARNYAIGRDGRLPWHYPADLKHFRETTTGNAVVMGANTWASLGKPLPNRFNVVLSGSSSVTPPPEVMRLMEKDEVVDLSRHINRDTYIIGGAKIYKAFAGDIQKWIVTWIPEDIEDADTFMPRDFLNDFVEVDSHELDGGLIVSTLCRK
ncbi:MAG: dihydrofolate reductase [Pyrinomonadaceae bacterium]|nr:dihydrofolate reductase [Pyrinomonadaceae bacterium]